MAERRTLSNGAVMQKNARGQWRFVSGASSEYMSSIRPAGGRRRGSKNRCNLKAKACRSSRACKYVKGRGCRRNSWTGPRANSPRQSATLARGRANRDRNLRRARRSRRAAQ